MELPLVVGVDGSDPSLQAVGEAARRGLPLRLVHGSLWERYEGGHPSVGTEPPAETLMAEHVIAFAAERATLRDPEVKVSGEVMPDDAASALLREGQDATALIMGSRAVTRSIAASSGSLIAVSREVCNAMVFSTATGRPGVSGTTSRWRQRRLADRGTGSAGDGPSTAVRAAMAIWTPEVLVRQVIQITPGCWLPVRTLVSWRRSRAR